MNAWARNPEAIKGFLRAFSKSVKDVIADPVAAVKTVKERDGIIDEKLELRRLKLAISTAIATADARAEGFGEVQKPRLALMASQVADAFGTKTRINPDTIFNSSYLPTKEQRNVLGK